MVYDYILENGLLTAIRIWLEPLQYDGSLPIYDIRKGLFELLTKLPIRSEHLRESGIGKVILFYTKTKREQPDLQRICQSLIKKWMRPLINGGQTSKSNVLDTAAVDIQRKTINFKKNFFNSSNEESDQKRENEKIGKQMATIPKPIEADFSIAPVSRIDQDTTRINQERKKRELRYKRMMNGKSK